MIDFFFFIFFSPPFSLLHSFAPFIPTSKGAGRGKSKKSTEKSRREIHAYISIAPLSAY
jgi:hypothetical protein